MLRKPTKRCHFRRQPITFSQFARFRAQFSTSSTTKAINVRPPTRSSSKLLDIGAVKDTLRGRCREQSESSDEDSPQEAVQADFAFFDPKPDDFHGVKMLLQSYLDEKQWDLSGFVDLILAQTTVGTVVKLEDDEDNAIFAVLSALNLERYKDHKSFFELKGYLLKVCQDRTFFGELKSLLEDQAEHVGLLVSQRVMNLPPQLLPHLHNALFDEISWATEDEPTEDLRKSFQFKYYLMITKIYKKNTNSKRGCTSNNDDEIIYLKPEEELLHQLSMWSIAFPLCTQPIGANELKNYRLTGLVMAVDANKTPNFRDQLRSFVDES